MTSSGVVFILISLFGLVSTIVTVYHLSLFLSFYESTEQASRLFNGGHVYKSEYSWVAGLFKDFILILFFVLQHSIMALPSVKRTFQHYKLDTIQRSLYVIATCFSLQCLMRFWEPTSSHVWWAVVGNGPGLRILWRITHICSWILIYVGSIVLDLLELLGIRQVFYAMRSLPTPMAFKSTELQRFYQHMRHPSFCGLSAIFWLCPVMTTDRLLLAVVCTVYMASRWTVDKDDFSYQKEQTRRKTEQLAEMKCQFT